MKKSFIYGMLAVVGATLASCNDFLDDNRWPLDVQSNNPAYWSNAVNVQGQIDQMYNNFYGYGNTTGRNGTFYFESLNDDQVGHWGSSVQFNNWSYLAVPGTSSVWNSTYTVLRHINSIIEGVESGSLANQKQGLEFLGIARLNRAWQYYDLVRHFGDVPLVLTVLDPADDAALFGPRTPRNQVMDQVLEDLNYAISNISTESNKIAFSRDLAYAMKAEICLYEASMAKYHQNDNTRANKFYNEVVSACQELMDGRYELEPEYGTIYNSIWDAADGIPSLRTSKEVIFMKGYKQDVLQHSLIKYTNVGEILGMSKDAFDSYLFLDGKPMSQQVDKNDEGIIPVYKIRQDDGTVSEVKGQLNIKHCLAARDKRLSATIDTCVFYVGYTWSRPNGADMESTSGYGVKKFHQPKFTFTNATTDNKNYTCAPLYWLAEIYLAYAEAKAELETITDADLNMSINKLFARAGLPEQTVAGLNAISDQANNMNISSLKWEIRRCRRCELMFDKGQRYWDLVRWHQLELLDNTKYPNVTLGANVKNAMADHVVKATGDYMDIYQGTQRVFSEREYLFPLAVDQLNLNIQLKQNPGW